jgi:hypothetical protein
MVLVATRPRTGPPPHRREGHVPARGEALVWGGRAQPLQSLSCSFSPATFVRGEARARNDRVVARGRRE